MAAKKGDFISVTLQPNSCKRPTQWFGSCGRISVSFVPKLSEHQTHTHRRCHSWLPLNFSFFCSPQSVSTTRPCTWCPSPATANRSVLLPSATRPLGTPAFQEPGSTSVWCILVVGLFVLPRFPKYDRKPADKFERGFKIGTRHRCFCFCLVNYQTAPTANMCSFLL